MGDQQVIVLLDTHVWIWAFEGSQRLGASSREILQDPKTERWISAVSTLEIARLIDGGDLQLHCSLVDWFNQSTNDLLLKSHDITHEIAMKSYQLPGTFHRDPADRQIVATAIVKKCTLLTADERILYYTGVKSLDARL